MQEYKKYGITYFTKTDGSRMDISNYVKMKTSDVVISTFRNAFFAEMLAKGVELVQVKRLPTTAVECDNCRPYDEKVLSLQEKVQELEQEIDKIVMEKIALCEQHGNFLID